MNYHSLVLIHIVSSTLLFGTGLGTAFFKYMNDRSGNLHAMAVTAKNVVLADWVFTSTSVIVQPVTGYLLADAMGIPVTHGWLSIALILYVVVGLCWLPVVYLQIKMRDLLHDAIEQGSEIPPHYYRLSEIWFWLGVPAFIGVVAIFYLMVFKPAF